eukprot:358511-Chlamydomonas_euryale.AAC.3
MERQYKGGASVGAARGVSACGQAVQGCCECGGSTRGECMWTGSVRVVRVWGQHAGDAEQNAVHVGCLSEQPGHSVARPQCPSALPVQIHSPAPSKAGTPIAATALTCYVQLLHAAAVTCYSPYMPKHSVQHAGFRMSFRP